MLEIPVLALEILHEESSQIGQEINGSKTKLQVFDDTSTPPSTDILRETTHHKTTRAFFEQPSTIVLATPGT